MKEYCLIAGAGDGIEELDEKLPMSGLFAWKYVFDRLGKGGDFVSDVSRESLEKYDYVHINYTPSVMSLVGNVRERLGRSSDTKIIVNIDHSIGIMDNAYDPTVLRKMLADADRVFCTEGYMQRRLSRFLQRSAWHIPHPCDVETLRKVHKKPSPEAYTISCQHHRYLNTWATYYFATRTIKREFDASVILMNHVIVSGVIRPTGFFDDVIGRTKYPEYIEMLSKVFANMDTTLDYTYGRGVVDAAALGIPTVGSNTIEAMRKLFPDLACGSVDDGEMENKLMRLATDPEFASTVANNASKAAEDEYGFERCMKRWRMMVE